MANNSISDTGVSKKTWVIFSIFFSLFIIFIVIYKIVVTKKGKVLQKTTETQPEVKNQNRITMPICDDLKGNVFFALKKPNGNKTQMNAKIVEFTEKKLFVQYGEMGCSGHIECEKKSNEKYQGKWSEVETGDRHEGLIELEAVMENGLVAYLKGNSRGEKNKISAPCWISGSMLTF